MQVSICAVLSIQLVLVLAISCGVFLYTIVKEEQSIAESLDHGEAAAEACFDHYLESIETIGQLFIKDISLQLSNHVRAVVESAEAKARSAAEAVERTNFMEGMATNSWHGSEMLPSFAWMILGPLETYGDEDEAVVQDIVIAGLNSTEEYNDWVWFGLNSRNPNRELDCDFYYYRNATNASSSIWCIDDLYDDPSHKSPSIYPHLFSPAIVKLQNATPCEAEFEVGQKRPLMWMPLNFFVWTYNVVALTSVVGAVKGPNGSCQGFAAANVKFESMSEYLTSLVSSARYDDVNIALIESSSGTILGTSLGSAIYTENQTRSDGTTVEQQLPALLSQMEHPLATALNLHVEESYGSIEDIPVPHITSANLDGQEYLISFDRFSRPTLNMTLCAFVPRTSITGPIETQQYNSHINYKISSDHMVEHIRRRFINAVAIGVVGLLACATVASFIVAYLSLRIQALVKFMGELRLKISNLGNDDSARGGSTPTSLCEPLPPGFFPIFETTQLKDLNAIGDATEELCSQLHDTWNDNQEVFRRALEQRQFTASIAHDIRNPVHGVLGIVSMMQSNLDEHKDKLPLLADTLKHMAMLLNDMVDLSKIQGGKVTRVLETFDAWDVVNEVLSLHQSSIGSGGGSLSCTCVGGSRLPKAYADQVHVQRLLTNFVSNAAKYAAGSEIKLMALTATREQVQSQSFLDQLCTRFVNGGRISSKYATLEHEEYIVLGCLDGGRGINPRKIGQVFEAYQQTRASDRFQGAGLGLAIARGLAIQLGGGIGVQSQEGSGSLFWVVVPSSHEEDKGKPALLDSDPSPPKEITTSIRSLEREPDADSVGCDVLVVDDTNLNLMLLKHFLKRLDMKPTASTSAAEGLELLRKDPDKFSMIISDFNMPDMSGGEFCLEVRRDPELCHLPFICSSGNNLTNDEKDTFKIDDSIMKPYTVDQLRAIIESHLHRPSKWSGSS